MRAEMFMSGIHFRRIHFVANTRCREPLFPRYRLLTVIGDETLVNVLTLLLPSYATEWGSSMTKR